MGESVLRPIDTSNGAHYTPIHTVASLAASYLVNSPVRSRPDMSSKPEYVDLLNDIRLQENRAGVYLEAWANKTTNNELKECLSFVAAREYSHGDIFDRRVKELGFSTQEIEDPEFEDKVRVVTSSISDAEKIAWLKEQRSRMTSPSVRERYEAATVDESVDSLTRSLLRWFTDVEDDSVVRMGKVYAEIEKAG